jgi:hypothetical protein
MQSPNVCVSLSIAGLLITVACSAPPSDPAPSGGGGSGGAGDSASSGSTGTGLGGAGGGATTSSTSSGSGGAGAAGGGTTSSGGGAGGTSSSTGSGGASGTSPSLAGCTIFPADNPWNQDVSALPVHPNSSAYIDSIGRTGRLHPDFGTTWNGAPIGIPFVVVDSAQPSVPIDFVAYGDESDPGPYPVPANAPIEGGPNGTGDRHVLVVDRDACLLYELYRAFPVNGGALWEADSGAVFDLTINDHHPQGWTSADAAGLPILPGLVRYEEVVEQGEITHALRFTVSKSQRGYIFPARHFASSDTSPNLPPMGLRLRMKAGYDCSAYSTEVQVVCAALKRYGMLVADNGSNWYVSGAPDSRWDDTALQDLGDIPGDAFEAVDTGPVVGP